MFQPVRLFKPIGSRPWAGPPTRLRPRRDEFAALLIGGTGAAIAAAPSLKLKFLLSLPAPLLTGLKWLLGNETRWLMVLFFSLILLPPFPAPFGNSGVHVAPLLALAGLIVGVRGSHAWQPLSGVLPQTLLVFAAIIFSTTGLAALYSGAAIALGSLTRVLLFAIAVYVFFYAAAGPSARNYSVWKIARWLYLCAIVAALFACIDFYYQLPTLSGFGPQYIWTDSGVFRRAQGLFYEASTLGNFCAFFLTMALVAAFRRVRPLSLSLLCVGSVLLLSALVFSYSRGSAVNLLIAAVAFATLQRVPIRRLAIPAVIIAAITAVILRFATPEFFSHYFVRIGASFEFFGEMPDRILSGRLTTWSTIGDFAVRHPLDLLLGIGYKTLPYSNYVGEGLVADNTYLSLLIETGLGGLGAFVAMNIAMLRAAYRAARCGNETASFLGTWFFCFWCGELVQMLSGDLITYWRVLPLYFWVLGAAVRESTI